jgi:hypothetical protein
MTISFSRLGKDSAIKPHLFLMLLDGTEVHIIFGKADVRATE